MKKILILLVVFLAGGAGLIILLCSKQAPSDVIDAGEEPGISRTESVDEPDGEPPPVAGGSKVPVDPKTSPLDALGSGSASEQRKAVKALKGLTPKERCALLRKGLFSENPRTALACAWALDWACLDLRELDRKMELLLPYAREMYNEPVEGLGQACGVEEMESYRHAMGFRHLTRLLKNFPGPAKGEEDTVPGLFEEIHRSMAREHIPLLIGLTKRDESVLADRAFSKALFLSQYTAGFWDEIAEMLLRLDPCAGRIKGVDNPNGFLPRPPGPVQDKPGLPSRFIECTERFHFCARCRAAKGFRTHGWIVKFLGRWARTLEPASGDLPLLRRLAGGPECFLRLWSIRKLGAFQDRESAALLKKFLTSDDDFMAAMAASSLVRQGDKARLEDLAAWASEGEPDSLVLLRDSSEKKFLQVLPSFLEAAENPEEFIPCSRIFRQIFHLAGSEQDIHVLGDCVLASAESADPLLAYFPALVGGAKAEAARKAIEFLWNLSWSGDSVYDHLDAFPFLEACAPEEFRRYLEHAFEKELDKDSKERLAAMLRTLRSKIFPDPGAGLDLQTLERQIQERERGEFWNATSALALAGDEAAQQRLLHGHEQGVYGVWTTDEGMYLGSSLDHVPFLLRSAETNCCTLVSVNSAWEELFGFDHSDRFDQMAYWPLTTVLTPREILETWWKLHKETLVLSRLSGKVVPGPGK